MNDGWTHIRIRQSTLTALKSECERMALAVTNGYTDRVEITDRVGNQPGCGVSPDQLIQLMLLARETHRRRRRKAKTSSAEPVFDVGPLVEAFLDATKGGGDDAS